MQACVFLPALVMLAFNAAAQQRKPALELYALSGGYFHGNLTMSHEWQPQGGAGVLVPLGRRWGALVDVVTSTIERNWRPDPVPGSPDDVHMRERRVALTPSVVHLWRRDRFSIYAGGGVGQEHERKRARYRIADGPVVDVESSRTDSTLLLRAGTVVSLGRNVVFRADLSVLPRYMDETPSKGLTVGAGYRF